MIGYSAHKLISKSRKKEEDDNKDKKNNLKK